MLALAASFRPLALAHALPLVETVGPCRIEAPAGHERTLRALAMDARRMLPVIEADLDVRPSAPFRMLLVPPGRVSDHELAALDAAAPPWAAGFMLPEARIGAIRMALAANYPYGSLASVLAHESTHQLLHDAVGRRLPRWFEEGAAMWEERRWSFTDAAILSGALLGHDPPALADWDEAFAGSPEEARLGYASAFSFVASESRRLDPSLVRRLVHATLRRSFADAWAAEVGEPLAVSHDRWRRRVVPRYRWPALVAGSSPLWLAIALLAALAGLRRGARARDQRRRWLEEERRARELGP